MVPLQFKRIRQEPKSIPGAIPPKNNSMEQVVLNGSSVSPLMVQLHQTSMEGRIPVDPVTTKVGEQWFQIVQRPICRNPDSL